MCKDNWTEAKENMAFEQKDVGLQWNFEYKNIPVVITYGCPYGKETIMLAFKYEKSEYNCFVQDSRFLDGINYDLLLKLEDDQGSLTDFYKQLGEFIIQNITNPNLVVCHKLSAFWNKEDSDPDSNLMDWIIAESKLIDVNRFVGDSEFDSLDNDTLNKLYDYVEKYGIITEHNCSFLELSDHNTDPSTNKIKRFLKEKGMNFDTGALYINEKEAESAKDPEAYANYGYGEIMYLYDKDILESINFDKEDVLQPYQKAVLIALAIAFKYRDI